MCGKKKIVMILFIILIILMMGCNQEGLISSRFRFGDLRVNFSPPAVESRTIDTDLAMDISTYTISGFGPTGSTFSQSGITEASVLFEKLLVGNWQINVQGYNTDGFLIGEGSSEVQLMVGEIVETTIVLLPVEGLGTYSIQVQWSASEITNPALVATAVYLSGETSEAVDLAVILSEGSALASGSLANGFYMLTLTLQDNSIPVWIKTEVLRIVAGGNSSQVFTLGVDAPIDSYFSDFYFSVADNPSFLLVNAEGSINHIERTISVEVPVGTVLNSLIPTFTTGSDIEISVNGVTQHSGISNQDFSSPVSYVVYADGMYLCSYSVTVDTNETRVVTERTGNFSLSLDFNGTPHDVYYVLTNPSASTNLAIPQVTLGPGQSFGDRRSQLVPKTFGADGPLIMNKPGVDEFNARLPMDFASDTTGSRAMIFEPVKSVIGDVQNFFIDINGNASVLATCKKVVGSVDTVFGQKNLYIWVENRSIYPSGDRAYLVTQEMVDVLAEKFLKTGSGNDIYDWVSAIYGEEWGATGSSVLIQDTADIHILLKDIDGDNSTTGGVLGYYWAKDNYKRSALGGSNEKLIFYMDSVLLAVPDGAQWDVTDYWPQYQISTLAHEFQHMVHFYQKNVLKGVSTEVWLNEMCSLVAEDFVADKLMITGPRGVTFSGSYDYSAGSPWLYGGRLPRYNRYNDDSVNVWLGGSDVLRSYSIAYAFGAYLARNFGGAPFFKSIMDSSYGNHLAVMDAVDVVKDNASFAEILSAWGTAVVLSDRTDGSELFSYNNGSYFESFQEGIPYRLGSINLENYVHDSIPGPKYYTGGAIGNGLKASNAIFREAQVTSRTYDFAVPEGYVMTMVIK